MSTASTTLQLEWFLTVWTAVTEDKANRERGGKTTSGSGENKEETGCEVICGAQRPRRLRDRWSEGETAARDRKDYFIITESLTAKTIYDTFIHPR